ncbi:MAG: NAD(P)-dependent oxidoreductase [Rectinema sp.]
MRVFVTGGFGNVGMSTVRALLSFGHDVCIFEHPSARSRRQKRLRELLRDGRDKLRIFYGDITDAGALSEAMACAGGPDAVIHLAGIIPPLADREPKLASRVNVGGTRALLEVCKLLDRPPRVIFASSVALYGDRLATPWISIQDPVAPNDTYSVTKNECEALLRASGLEWVILRLSYVVSSDWLPFSPQLYDVPPATRLEVVHTEDAGRAFAKASDSTQSAGRIFNIGGGPGCRTTYRAYLDRLMRYFGLGSSSFLPDGLFAKGKFHCGWFTDSDAAESLLHFRSKTIEDYYSEVSWRMRAVRPLGSIAAWAVKPWIRSLSPYQAKAGRVRSPQFV